MNIKLISPLTVDGPPKKCLVCFKYFIYLSSRLLQVIKVISSSHLIVHPKNQDLTCMNVIIIIELLTL